MGLPRVYWFREFGAIDPARERIGSGKSWLGGVALPVTEEDEPWAIRPSRRGAPPPITGPLPEYVEVARGNQVFIDRTNLPPALVTRILRVASYQNPEFYRAQAMRFATYDKPRVVSCAELLPKHVAVPRGCFEEIKDLLGMLKIEARVRDVKKSGYAFECNIPGRSAPGAGARL